MKYILTERGIRYITRVNSQIINMHLLRADVGTGFSDNPDLLTVIADKKQGLQIDGITAETDMATIHCTLTNLNVAEEYCLRQIGIVAWDPERGREELIIVGQDAEGDRIPAVTEREVQYLYNIGVKVSNTAEMEQRGKVTVGTVHAPMEKNEIRFIVDEMPYYEENGNMAYILDGAGNRVELTTEDGRTVSTGE